MIIQDATFIGNFYISHAAIKSHALILDELRAVGKSLFPIPSDVEIAIDRQPAYYIGKRNAAVTDLDIERAKSFLHLKVENTGDRLMRRNSREVGWAHSERVATLAYNFARFIYGDDKEKINRVVIKALLHDAVEDFGASLKEVELLFGKNVARSVERITTPPPAVLARKYTDIAPGYIEGAAPTVEIMETKLAELKRHDRAKYKELKSKLAMHYKMETSKTYDVDDVIVKIADNGDTPRSDERDIVTGRIHVVGGRIYPVRPDTEEKPPKIWSADKLREKIGKRTAWQNALIARLETLRETHEKRPIPGLKYPNFAGLISYSMQYFESKILNLENTTGLSLRPAALPAPTLA